MKCPNCHARVFTQTPRCPNCGLRLQDKAQPIYEDSCPIPSHIPYAVLSLFFCLPTALVSLICALSVSSYQREGDVKRARQAAIHARNWAFVSFAIPITMLLFGILFVALYEITR